MVACLFYPETHPTLPCSLLLCTAVTAPPPFACYVFAVFISCLFYNITLYHIILLLFGCRTRQFVCQAIESYATNSSKVNGTWTGPHSSTHKTLLFVASDNLGNQEESCIPYCTLLYCHAVYCTVLYCTANNSIFCSLQCICPSFHAFALFTSLHTLFDTSNSTDATRIET